MAFPFFSPKMASNRHIFNYETSFVKIIHKRTKSIKNSSVKNNKIIKYIKILLAPIGSHLILLNHILTSTIVK